MPAEVAWVPAEVWVPPRPVSGCPRVPVAPAGAGREMGFGTVCPSSYTGVSQGRLLERAFGLTVLSKFANIELQEFQACVDGHLIVRYFFFLSSE